MAKKTTSITVKDTPIRIVTVNDEDYISLTDMLRAKDGDFFISDWLRNRSTIVLLGLWEQLSNPDFELVEFDQFRFQAGENAFVMTPS